jgi:hypothetical protein
MRAAASAAAPPSMGLAGPWTGLLGFAHVFFFFSFFVLIYQGGHQSASVNIVFTVTLGLRRKWLPASENTF